MWPRLLWKPHLKNWLTGRVKEEGWVLSCWPRRPRDSGEKKNWKSLVRMMSIGTFGDLKNFCSDPGSRELY